MRVPNRFFSAECVVIILANTKMCTKHILLRRYTSKTKCSFLAGMNSTMDSGVSDIIRKVSAPIYSQGVGRIDLKENGRMNFTAKNFQINETYEFRINATKGDRTSVATLYLYIVEADAPIPFIGYHPYFMAIAVGA